MCAVHRHVRLDVVCVAGVPPADAGLRQLDDEAPPWLEGWCDEAAPPLPLLGREWSCCGCLVCCAGCAGLRRAVSRQEVFVQQCSEALLGIGVGFEPHHCW